MVLNAFIDESYDEDRFVVVSLLASAEQWSSEFEPAWHRILEDNELHYFHMVDFANQVGPYANWTEPRRRAFIDDAALLVRRSVDHGSVVFVLRSDWKKWKVGLRLCGFPSEYSWCCSHCLLDGGTWVREHRPGAKIAVFAEKGAVGERSMRHLGRVWCATQPDVALLQHGEPVVFAGKSALSPLQGADIVAYSLLEELQRKDDYPDRPQRRSSKRMFSRREDRYHVQWHMADLFKEVIESRIYGMLGLRDAFRKSSARRLPSGRVRRQLERWRRELPMDESSEIADALRALHDIKS